MAAFAELMGSRLNALAELVACWVLWNGFKRALFGLPFKMRITCTHIASAGADLDFPGESIAIRMIFSSTTLQTG